VYKDAGPLIGVLREREAEVRDIMTSVPGFLMYGLMETGGGGIVSLTICKDRAGTDESIARAAEWIMTNTPAGTKIDPPQIVQGEPVVRFQAEGIPDRGAHVAMRIFGSPTPPGLSDRADAIREFMAGMPGFRSYTAVASDGGGLSIITGDDKAATDKIGERMLQFVTSTYPEVQPRPVAQLIEGTSLFRFEAQVARV
jgi:hypothetical protein